MLVLAATVLGQPAPSVAQNRADTTDRTITLPAPENGIIYIRSGPPGGVRIRSRRTPSGGRPQPLRRAPVDLEQLARAFDRQGLNLRAERLRRGGDVFIVLRDAETGAVADTLSEQEARALAESFGGAIEEFPGEAGIPPRDTTLAARIERSILDLGLFRSLQVHFEFDRSDLLLSSRSTIEAVADVMRRYPDLKLVVAGHTDAIGTEAYNERLSQRRAASVVGALIEQGVGPRRLEAAGYGERRPILTNDTPTGRALNRRVEFGVIGDDADEIEVRE